jgi:hypothetical protein
MQLHLLLALASQPQRLDDDRSLPMLAAMALIGLFLIIFFVLKLLRRKGQKKEEDARDKMVEEGIKLGHLTKDGHAACVICGHRASENAPVTGLSVLDSISFLSRLFALPPRYIIVDAEGRGFEYCKIHKDVAVAQLEEFQGLLRAERAHFNAEQAKKVARMDGGGVQVNVRKHYNEVIAHLQEVAEGDYDNVRHLLPAASQSDHTAVSTLSSTPAEEDPLDFPDVS